MATAVISRVKIDLRLAAGLRPGTASRRYLRCLARGDRDECSYCGCELTDENRTIDHKVSVLRGGSNRLKNLCLACHTCNGLKGMKTPDEFFAYLRKKAKQAKKNEPKPVVPSLGVRHRQREGVPIASLVSAESFKALLLIVEKPPCAACELLQRTNPRGLCPEHGVEF